MIVRFGWWRELGGGEGSEGVRLLNPRLFLSKMRANHKLNVNTEGHCYFFLIDEHLIREIPACVTRPK